MGSCWQTPLSTGQKENNGQLMSRPDLRATSAHWGSPDLIAPPPNHRYYIINSVRISFLSLQTLTSNLSPIAVQLNTPFYLPVDFFKALMFLSALSFSSMSGVLLPSGHAFCFFLMFSYSHQFCVTKNTYCEILLQFKRTVVCFNLF